MIACLDSDCVIYLVEQHPTWGGKVAARLASLRTAGDEIAVTDLSRAECLVGPLHRQQAAILADYQAFFRDPGIRVLRLTAAVCEQAARIRAASNLRFKLPDCIQLAAAIEHGCGLFLTHDAQLASLPTIAVEILT